jgi:uncharacterized protein
MNKLGHYHRLMESAWVAGQRLALRLGLTFSLGLLALASDSATPPSAAGANAEKPNSANSPQTRPNGNKLQLKVGDKEFWVEVAVTPAQQQLGLMYRTKMGEDEGMLFVYAAPHRPTVWMKNTILPLSCAFMDRQGRILEILDLVSLSETPVAPKVANVSFMLEMNRGWFDQNEIKVGAVVSSARGPLGSIFRGR